MAGHTLRTVKKIAIALIFEVILCGAAFSQEGSNLIREDGLLAVEIVEDKWSSTEIYRSGNPGERFYQVRVFEYQGRPLFVFIGAIFETDGINIYIVEYDGAMILKSRVPYTRGTGYYFDNSRNIRIKDETIYYFIDRDYTGSAIDLNTREVSLGDYFPFEKKPAYQTEFTSLGGARTVKVGTISLTVVDNSSGDETVLFEQPYSGSWSIGQIVWADDDVFYFDNSGAVACIWKVDLLDMTLSKVVPEHIARHPYYFEGGRGSFVAYIEGNYVKIAKPDGIAYPQRSRSLKSDGPRSAIDVPRPHAIGAASVSHLISR